HVIRDFELSGVALAPAQRARYAAVSAELTALSTAFGDAVLDATDAWSEHVTDPGLLAGAPEAAMVGFAAAAKDKGLEGWLVTLQQPSVSAILTFVENRDLRARVYEAMGTRASDQGPHAGRFDNSARIARTLELRREIAALLGFDTPVAWSLATKMAVNAQEVLDFLRDFAGRAKPYAEREMAELSAFAARELGLDALEPWDLSFASNRLRAERYAFEEHELRAYFPVEQVITGWKALLEGLYGIRLHEREDVDLWSPHATYFDVVDEAGVVQSGLYVDLHARAGKRGGAWMAPARPRLADGSLVGKPAAYLTCNFAPKLDDKPSLLSHGDIKVLLHETGHCLHQLFTQVDRPVIAGISGVEWDAIELPSQLMEDFAWDFEVLRGMSRHVETGESLPRELFESLQAARYFQEGLGTLRQIEISLFDLLLHQGQIGDDPAAVLAQVRAEVAVFQPPAWHRFAHAFTHVFAGSYASGYYSYLWAEVLAADGFKAFAEAGLIDRATGDRFRAEVLARGASRPAADSFRAFRGRDADPQALLERKGMAA
uniref:M3 family metallopeptidase n=1 Tax=uncultured Caulobacter sp. TaxID=158749 RepID=UPI0025EABB6A